MDAVAARFEALENTVARLDAENRELRAFKERTEHRFNTWRRSASLFMAVSVAALGIALAPARPATAQTAHATLEERVVVLEQKLLYVSRVGRQMIFNAVNVHVRNGGTQTPGANGLGNLIVGFNAQRGDGTDNRTGSLNEISGPYATVSGGQNNVASGSHTAVSGGGHNTASGKESTVGGGLANSATGDNSSVSGGANRSVTGSFDWRAGTLNQDQ